MKCNMLTVENEKVGVNRFNQAVWLCRCDCGAPTIVIASAVRNGRTLSCGCLKAGNARTHGHKALRSKAYSTWCNMKNRCNSPSNSAWGNYGGRGITYDQRWKSFENFLEDMGEPPDPSFSIDRIDNDGNYCKSNCRWADKQTQRRNNRQLVWCEIEGERLILIDAVKKYGKVPYGTAVNRIFQGWSPEKAVLTPYTRNFAHSVGTGTRYEFNGQSKTLAEWSRELGIGRVTMLKRLQRGWSVQKALTAAPAY